MGGTPLPSGAAGKKLDVFVWQFLHADHDRFLTLRGKLYPGSVRDQQVRAELLVEKTAQEGWWGPERPLVIFGGGLGGVTAAMAAAARKFDGESAPVILVERRASLFTRQRLSDRRLEPVGYDWPHPHSLDEKPRHGCLELKVCESAKAVDRWEEQILAFSKAHPNLREIYRLELDERAMTFDPSKKVWTLPLRPFVDEDAVGLAPAKFGESLEAGCVIHCGGFGQERIRFANKSGHAENNHESVRFWEQDDLLLPNFGLGALTPRILIAGGGDGAIQDVLRALTKRTAIELLRDLHSCISLPLQKKIFAIEDQTSRALNCIPATASTEHENYAAFAMEQWNDLARSIRRESRLVKGLRNAMRKDLKPGFSIDVCYKGPALGPCYGINRLFALLCHQDESIPVTLREFEVDRAHVPALFKSDYSGALWGQETLAYNALGESAGGPYNIVLNRTGIDAREGQPQVVQMLPYWLHGWPRGN
jgi:hypothetical protein